MGRRKTDMGVSRRWRQKGVLTALGFVFAASAFMRIGSLEFAMADPAPSSPVADAGAAYGPPGMGAASALPLVDALADVEALRDRLIAREAQLVDRERAVAAAQILVEDRLAELEAAEARLADLVAVSDRAAEADLDQLTRVYETMPPDEAALLFGQMAPSFAAGFMARMSPAGSAALMSELEPDVAYAISLILATRNASAPVMPRDPQTADTEN